MKTFREFLGEGKRTEYNRELYKRLSKNPEWKKKRNEQKFAHYLANAETINPKRNLKRRYDTKKRREEKERLKHEKLARFKETLKKGLIIKESNPDWFSHQEKTDGHDLYQLDIDTEEPRGHDKSTKDFARDLYKFHHAKRNYHINAAKILKKTNPKDAKAHIWAATKHEESADIYKTHIVHGNL